ncbi:putative LRR receptor-like serine/threonine-protein kinase-like [Capsicum annuum]|nr:putative LRR receptor-like serine/threonine-protein kinase-like [Capsicum annuum]
MEKAFTSFLLTSLLLHYVMARSAMTKTSITTDQLALFSLKSQIASDPFHFLDESWSFAMSICHWVGVTCGSRHQHVNSLNLSNMDLTGKIPHDLGNLTFLVFLDLGSNNFHGNLPQEMAHLRRLKFLDLSFNSFRGEVPSWFGFLHQFQVLKLGNNSFTGSIPFSFSNISELETLNLKFNSIEGQIPKVIGNLLNLRVLNLGGNKLVGSIPTSLLSASRLEPLEISYNSLQGNIPEGVGNLHNMNWLGIQYNQHMGSIPFKIFNISRIEVIAFTGNSLSGSLPKVFNLQLDAAFKSFDTESEVLCSLRHRNLVQILELGSNHFSGLAILFVPIIFVFVWIRYRRGKRAPQQADDSLSTKKRERISYYELLQATDDLSESNLIGSGSFGSVYKGILKSGTVVAVKVFKLQLDAAFKSFDTECEVLRSLRHRNLVKVITSCSNLDFKALVLVHMPNGSLEKYLYSHNYYLDTRQRLSIMIDVACALEYLHHGCSSPVIHCDLKPSNVLLDENMVAHLSDFGISKLLGEDQGDFYTKTLATLGYIAPEYGLEGLVSTKCDIYSYGVMLLETFTRRKPNEFEGDLSLTQWVSYSLPDAVMDVVDANLVTAMGKSLQKELDVVASIMKVALDCCAESPARRTNMKDAVGMLQKIKIKLLAC